MSVETLQLHADPRVDEGVTVPGESMNPNPENLDRCFSALADPTRRYMLEALRDGSRTVSQLAEPLPMSLPAVQKHLRVLEDAGLIETEKRGRARHCRLSATPMAGAADYIDGYQAFWDHAMGRLSEMIDEDR